MRGREANQSDSSYFTLLLTINSNIKRNACTAQGSVNFPPSSGINARGDAARHHVLFGGDRIEKVLARHHYISFVTSSYCAELCSWFYSWYVVLAFDIYVHHHIGPTFVRISSWRIDEHQTLLLVSLTTVPWHLCACFFILFVYLNILGQKKKLEKYVTISFNVC